jgi:hypothetical protein
MPDPSTPRQAERYARLKAGTPWQPTTCKNCGGNTTGGYTKTPLYDPWCRRCWEKLTPEGRHAKAKRVRETRARAKAKANCNNLQTNAPSSSRFSR